MEGVGPDRVEPRYPKHFSMILLKSHRLHGSTLTWLIMRVGPFYFQQNYKLRIQYFCRIKCVGLLPHRLFRAKLKKGKVLAKFGAIELKFKPSIPGMNDANL